MDKKEIIKMIKFFFFSISAGLIEIGSFTVLTAYTNLRYGIVYLTALILSVLWNFTLNRKFTFKSANNISLAMFKVFIYYLIFTPVSTILGSYLVDIRGLNEYLVTGINMILNLTTEYLYQNYVVYKNNTNNK